MSDPVTIDAIKQIVKDFGAMPGDVDALGATDDLYAAGLTSHATVQIMIACEDTFDVEFPDELLQRSTFSSLESIRAAVAGIQED